MLVTFTQGCLGIFEVFWDTVVLCLMTALVILIADTDGDSAIMLAINSYGKFTHSLGRIFIVCACVLFALATVCTQYYYGERSLSFFSSARYFRPIYGVIFISVCVFSCIISSELMWHISDSVIALLAIFNLIFLLLLIKEVRGEM